jgi:hypothetical protein
VVGGARRSRGGAADDETDEDQAKAKRHWQELLLQRARKQQDAVSGTWERHHPIARFLHLQHTGGLKATTLTHSQKKRAGRRRMDVLSLQIG